MKTHKTKRIKKKYKTLEEKKEAVTIFFEKVKRCKNYGKDWNMFFEVIVKKHNYTSIMIKVLFSHKKNNKWKFLLNIYHVPYNENANIVHGIKQHYKYVEFFGKYNCVSWLNKESAFGIILGEGE